MAVDIGGTFTDLVAWNDSDDRVVRTKVLTVADEPVLGVVEAVEKAGINLRDVDRFVHGSTIAINAVLQENGAKTALLTTRGFRDTLEMGRKNRPDMYNLFFEARRCPVPRHLRLEVDERLQYDGEVILPMDKGQLAATIDSLPSDVESIAICFLHSYADAQHEQSAAAMVRSARPDAYVTISSELSRVAGEYERTATVAVNAYVGPLVSRYVEGLKNYLVDESCPAPLLVTQSNGGVMAAEIAARQPVRTMESGPAAGVIGTAWLGSQLGIDDLIAFDMGGTSAKACVVQGGEPETSLQYFVGGKLRGLPVRVPFLEIVEVGAGGGSIAYVDAAGGLRVGPRSAGANPGPAAYGRGGSQPTITDANLIVGKIDPDYFLGGEMRLDAERAQSAMANISQALDLRTDECALGILRIANAIMVGAIREVTVARGRDPRDFTLVAYGGAGPLHAAALAADLQIPRVLIPAGPGTYAAFGMLVTDLRHDVVRTLIGRLDSFADLALEDAFHTLEVEAADYVRTRFSDRQSDPAISFVRRLDLRYVGQFHTLTVTISSDLKTFLTPVAALFHALHLERYGHNAEGEPIEIQGLRVTAISSVTKPATGASATNGVSDPTDERQRDVLFDDGLWRRCRVLRRHTLFVGTRLEGPAIIEDPASNIVLGHRDSGTVLPGGHILISVAGKT